jgi:hypothetical protein
MRKRGRRNCSNLNGRDEGRAIEIMIGLTNKRDGKARRDKRRT